MPSYKITMKDDQKILRRDNDDGTWSEIPFDEGNQDYAEYLELVQNGMEVVDETPPILTLEEQIAKLQAELEAKKAAEAEEAT